jgi:hypothetical protein
MRGLGRDPETGKKSSKKFLPTKKYPYICTPNPKNGSSYRLSRQDGISESSSVGRA